MIIDLFVLCARRGMAVWIIFSGIDAICEKTDKRRVSAPSALHQGMMCAGGVLCAGQREQFKKLEDPSEQQCGEHRADTDAVKRASAGTGTIQR